MTISILFVCLGNICRSPLAEGAFRAEAARRRLDVEVDSAGTGGWHEGEPPDRRAIAAAKKGGVDIGGLRARRVVPGDFDRFDHIFALDADNLRDLSRLRPQGGRAALSLLLDQVPGREGQEVADPYYGGEAEFDIAWRDVDEAARALVARLAEETII